MQKEDPDWKTEEKQVLKAAGLSAGSSRQTLPQAPAFGPHSPLISVSLVTCIFLSFSKN